VKPLFIHVALPLCIVLGILLPLYLLSNKKYNSTIGILIITLSFNWFIYLPRFTIFNAFFQLRNDYEGFVIIGFSENFNEELQIENQSIYFNFVDSSYQLHSLKYFEKLQEIPLSVNDEKDVDSLGYRKLFLNQIDTFEIGSNKLYVYNLFISKDYYENKGKEIVELMNKYSDQKKELVKHIKKFF